MRRKRIGGGGERRRENEEKGRKEEERGERINKVRPTVKLSKSWAPEGCRTSSTI